MKNILFVVSLAICCFIINSVKGQEYFPFPDSNAYWRIDYSTHYCYNAGIPDAEYQYMLTGDTILNDITYHKLERSGVCLGCCLPPLSNITLNGYIGAIRNDTIHKRVYLIFSGDSDEQVLYDFNLNVGDTIHNYFSNYGICQYLKIVKIDSVLIGTTHRRRFEIFGLHCHSFMIEGIGSTTGLLEPMSSMEQTGNLVCFNQNNQTLYPDTNTACDLATMVTNLTVPNKTFLIYPNPTNKYLNIEFTEITNGSHVSFQLFDLAGQRVYPNYSSSHQKISINLESLQKGIYCLIILIDNQYHEIQKIFFN